jgi:endo-1,4-beta-mannosidase
MPLSPGFVRTNGSQFTLDGQPFRVAGANNYYLGFETDAMVTPVLELAAQIGLNALRTWAFLDCGAALPGTAPAKCQRRRLLSVPEFDDRNAGFQRRREWT